MVEIQPSSTSTSPTSSLVFAPAAKVSFDPRPQMARIFVDGFYEWLKYFSKSKEKLRHAFEHAFILNAFYLAIGEHGEVLAMTACPEGAPSLALDGNELRKHLGFVPGSIAAKMLQKHLIDHTYPFTLDAETGSIEFVATAEQAQGQGIAGHLIEYVIQKQHYRLYVLEVAETNERAVRLYQRLGFTEKMRLPASKRSGVGNYLYLERTR